MVAVGCQDCRRSYCRHHKPFFCLDAAKSVYNLLWGEIASRYHVIPQDGDEFELGCLHGEGGAFFVGFPTAVNNFGQPNFSKVFLSYKEKIKMRQAL